MEGAMKTLKPSGLKKPTCIPKSVVPTDRLKPANSNIVSNGAAPGNRLPLTRDVSNFLTIQSKKGPIKRGSPDILNRPTQPFNRAKLRRSRSTSDLNAAFCKSLKRTFTALAPIPAKMTKFNSNYNLPATTSRNVATTSTASAATANKIQTNSKVVNRVGAGTLKNTNNSNGTKPKTGATGTSLAKTKKIPAYDYKARFNDLLEKHKILKEKYEEAKEQLSTFDSLPEKYEECQEELYKITKELQYERTEMECIQHQNSLQSVKITSLTKYLQEIKTELDKKTEDYEVLFKEHEIAMKELTELREKYSTNLAEYETMKIDFEICKDQLFKANIERRDLHNAVMDLKGNIRVFCRVRPPLDCEEGRLLCGWNFIDECTLEIQNTELHISGAKNKTASHIFSFDHIFHPKSSQDDIFQMVSPLIQSALDGYNICIFAYGQTGSGKTYTMDGIPPDNVGVIPRTVDLLFEAIKNYKRIGWEYEIKATFLEIYNEVLYDLLSNEQKEMEIRMAKNKTDIYVSNITEETVLSANQLRQLMQVAKMNRATAATVSNERSSRSHAVTKIELIGRHDEKGEISVGSLNLVDLAGSESPKTSIRMMETKNINRSLSELTNVILALLQKQDHIPYRNSKLTHLLMPSLGGNSKTLMFINVAPFQDCFVESVKSLRFAASVNSCKLAKAKKNKYFNTSNTSNSNNSNNSGLM